VSYLQVSKVIKQIHSTGTVGGNEWKRDNGTY